MGKGGASAVIIPCPEAAQEKRKIFRSRGMGFSRLLASPSPLQGEFGPGTSCDYYTDLTSDANAGRGLMQYIFHGLRARSSLQTRFRPKAQFADTFCMYLLCKTRFTRSTYARFPRTGFFATASAKSILRSLLRRLDQTRSTGLRPGDLAGMCQSFTPQALSADLEAFESKNDSLSHSTCHGPWRLVGFNF